LVSGFGGDSDIASKYVLALAPRKRCPSDMAGRVYRGMASGQRIAGFGTSSLGLRPHYMSSDCVSMSRNSDFFWNFSGSQEVGDTEDFDFGFGFTE
jgi:hypothetical protein